MKWSPARPLVTLLATLLIALASVASAARMAPEPAATPALVAYLAAGGSLDDLCADGPRHAEHHCPFCRLLADPPAVAFAPGAARLTFVIAWLSSDDLTRGPQGGHPGVSARAPPARA